MKTSRETYELTSAGIDRISERIGLFLETLKTERRSRMRVRLAFEEILLRLSQSPEPPPEVQLALGSRFGRPFISLRYRGVAFDPTAAEEGEEAEFSNRILVNLGLAPAFSCRNGRCQLLLKLPAAGSHTARNMAAAAAAGIALGLLGNRFLPAAAIADMQEHFITPVIGMFLGALTTFAGIMILLSVLFGITGVGDIAAFGKIGRRMIARFVGFTFLIAGAGAAGTFPLFRFHFSEGAGGESDQFGSVLQMFFDIVPKDPVSPFSNGNSLQVIFIAILLGVAILMLGGRGDRLRALIEQGNAAMQTVMELIGKLLPLFVFLNFLKSGLSGALQSMGSLWKPIAIFVLLSACMLLAYFFSVCIRERVKPLTLLKKISPAFFIGITTASSASAFPTAMQTLEGKLGVSKELSRFGLPIGNVLFMPASASNFLVTVFFLSEYYGAQVNLTWFVTAAVLCSLLAVAVPPVPGAGMTCYGVMIAQLGLPAEGVLIAATLDVVYDFIATAADITVIQLELVHQARGMDMLDRDALRSKE